MTIFEQLAETFELETSFQVSGEAAIKSQYDLNALSAACLGSVGLAVADLLKTAGVVGEAPPVEIDQRLAILWFAMSFQPIGWTPPPAWDPLAGDYKTKDGWIRLHTNSKIHKAAACRALGVEADRTKFEEAIANWEGLALETVFHEAGGIAAMMRSREEWLAHPNGQAVTNEKIVQWGGAANPKLANWKPSVERPLEGVKVLDLTRILAGPSSTRTLAGLGALVLRIDPLDWEEPNVEYEVTLGKNCTRLDLKSSEGRDVFERLIGEADLFVHGYRQSALEGLGFGAEWREKNVPDLLEVQINAYGWTGPWIDRRGYDSQLQMASGMTRDTMDFFGEEKPALQPLPAIDYAAGYSMAAAALRLINWSQTGRNVRTAKVSLARTAELIMSQANPDVQETEIAYRAEDFVEAVEKTPWGPGNRLKSPFKAGACELRWTKPASRFGSSDPVWPSQ